MENWKRAPSDAPEILDAFARAEDPPGRIPERLLVLAGLEGRRVLEIGCGTGRLAEILAPRAARYVAADPSRPALALAAARAREGHRPRQPAFVEARGERLPFRGGSADRVLAGWVLAYLQPAALAAVLAEARRVLARGRGAGIWAVENHEGGDFHELRGELAEVDRRGLKRLHDSHGFSVVEVLWTEIRFPSAAEAERVLGYLCGESVGERLRRRPVVRLSHPVVILHRPL